MNEDKSMLEKVNELRLKQDTYPQRIAFLEARHQELLERNNELLEKLRGVETYNNLLLEMKSLAN